MRKRLFSFIMIMALAVGMLGIIPASAATYTITVSSQEKYDMAFQELDLINNERVKNGLSKLTMDKDLLDAAMQRAAETYIVWDHTRPDGSDCFTAFDWEGTAGENIAMGYTSAESVTDGWMNSAGHRANILTSSFTSVGIGCVYIDGTYYWTQEFDAGSPVSVKASSNKTVSRTVKIDSSLKSQYVPSSAPTITSLTATSTSATIQWGKVKNANGYRVYKYNTTSKSYKSLATLSSGVTSYTDKNLTAGETAKYIVKAFRKNGAVTGWSAASAAKSVTAAPAKVTVSSASSTTTSVTLKWSKVNCDGYRIYRYDKSSGKYVYVGAVSASATSYRQTGLKSKTTYKYKVRAYNKTSSGSYVFGEYSAIKSVTTK